MRRCAAIVILLCGAALPAQAAGDFEALARRCDEAMQKWRQSAGHDAAPDFSTCPVSRYLPRIRAIAQKQAGKPDGLPPILWMLENFQIIQMAGTEDEDVASWCLAELQKHYVASDQLGDALPKMQYLVYSGVDDGYLLPFYRAVQKDNPDPTIKLLAMFNEAFTLTEQPDMNAAESQREKAKALFQRVAKEGGDSRAAKSARGYLFDFERLQVGLQVPDLAGAGLDGKELRLSQFKGQVVVLDFWGFW